MSRDFWDIDGILLTEEPVDVRFTTSVVGLGHLDPLRAASGAKDLPRGTHLSLPLWLIVPLAKSDFVDPVLPECYKVGMQNVLRKGSEGARFRDKSPNYFEVGLMLSWLTSNTDLASALFHGVLQRIKFIIDRSAHNQRNEVAESEFLHLLTNYEQAIYMAGVSSNEGFDQWRDGSLNEIKPRIDINLLKVAN